MQPPRLTNAWPMQPDPALETGAATLPENPAMKRPATFRAARRTFVLAQYSKIDNDDAGNCNFGANRLTISAGQELQGASFGIRHVF